MVGLDSFLIFVTGISVVGMRQPNHSKQTDSGDSLFFSHLLLVEANVPADSRTWEIKIKEAHVFSVSSKLNKCWLKNGFEHRWARSLYLQFDARRLQYWYSCLKIFTVSYKIKSYINSLSQSLIGYIKVNRWKLGNPKSVRVYIHVYIYTVNWFSNIRTSIPNNLLIQSVWGGIPLEQFSFRFNVSCGHFKWIFCGIVFSFWLMIFQPIYYSFPRNQIHQFQMDESRLINVNSWAKRNGTN